MQIFQGFLDRTGGILSSDGIFTVTRDPSRFVVDFGGVDVSRAFVLAVTTFLDDTITAQPVTACYLRNEPSKIFFEVVHGYGLSFRVEVPQLIPPPVNRTRKTGRQSATSKKSRRK